MSNKSKVIVGMKFGMWSVKEDLGAENGRNRRFLCACECGTQKPVMAYQLLNGASALCGCLRAFMSSQRMAARHQAKKHGECKECKAKFVGENAQQYCSEACLKKSNRRSRYKAQGAQYVRGKLPNWMYS